MYNEKDYWIFLIVSIILNLDFLKTLDTMQLRYDLWFKFTLNYAILNVMWR